MTDNARIYETEEQARSAIDRLVELGFSRSDTLLLTPSDNNDAAVRAAVDSDFLPPRYRRVITNKLNTGRTVVAVSPPFGTAQRVAFVLDSFNPVETSSLPTFGRANPSPLSDFLGIPTLSRSKSTTTLATGWSFSSAIGMPMLSRNPTPLSSLIGLKTLTDNKSKTRSFGMPLLSNNPTPLSSLIGLKTLTANKSKNSSFGLPLLSSNPTPLSSTFGLATLTRTNRDD